MSKSNFCNWLITICNILEFGVMIYAIIGAFKGNVVKLPVITKLVAKHFGEEQEVVSV